LSYKLPVSALVVVYTPDLRVLLLERADYPEHWQSVTGGQEPGETLQATAVRELREETGLDGASRTFMKSFRAGAPVIHPEPRTTPSTSSRSKCLRRSS